MEVPMPEQLVDAMPMTWPDAPKTVPTTMRAVVFRRFGGPEVREVAEVAAPPVRAGEVLIRVAAVSVGRLTSRRGQAPIPTRGSYCGMCSAPNTRDRRRVPELQIMGCAGVWS